MSARYEGDLTPLEAWELLENHEDAVLVDVRTEGEWREVGIPDLAVLRRRVVLAPIQTASGWNPDFLDLLSGAGLQPGDGRPLVFLCRSGVRSAAAAQVATSAGFGPAYNVSEGYEGASSVASGWQGLGLPVTSYEGES